MTAAPTTPRIYLIARPALDQTDFERFLRDRGLDWLESPGATDAEHSVEIGGRVCYMSFSNDPSRIRHPNALYIANLIEKGHDSVLEHATWTFIIDRVSRAFTHQLVRHRVGFAYSQLSQQYHDESDAAFVRPAGLTGRAAEIWEHSITAARQSYRGHSRPCDRDRGRSAGPVGGGSAPPALRGPQRAPQRHRDRDLHHGECPRAAPFPRAPRRDHRRYRNAAGLGRAL